MPDATESRLAGTITYSPVTFIAIYMLRATSGLAVVNATMLRARNAATQRCGP
jgi:hypothetical protein